MTDIFCLKDDNGKVVNIGSLHDLNQWAKQNNLMFRSDKSLFKGYWRDKDGNCFMFDLWYPEPTPPSGIGLQVTALFRNMLNYAGIEWKKCEELGEIFNRRVEDACWLSTDTGETFVKCESSAPGGKSVTTYC